MGSETLFLVIGLIVFALILGFVAGLLVSKRSGSEEALKVDLEETKAKLEASTERLSELKNELADTNRSKDSLREEKEKAQILISRLETEKSGVEKQVDLQRKDIQKMQEQFTKDFQILANQIFEEKSESFTKKSRESIDQLLAPLKEKLVSFEKKVDETHKENLKESSGLKVELKHLRELSLKMTEEAENLTKALKNDTKVQGNWGELILENILESSGLKKDREYFIQQNFKSENGKRFQPEAASGFRSHACTQFRPIPRD